MNISCNNANFIKCGCYADLLSPEDYQLGHMMNQVSLNYFIHLMLDIPCYICSTDDCSKL